MPAPNKKLRDAVEQLEAARDARQKLQTEEAELEVRVIELMQDQKISKVAVESGRICSLAMTEAKTKAKFTTPKDE